MATAVLHHSSYTPDDEQRRSEVIHAVLDRSDLVRIADVPRDADGEYIADPLIEDALNRNSRARARDHGRKGLLPVTVGFLDAICAGTFVQGFTCNEARASLLHALHRSRGSDVRDRVVACQSRARRSEQTRCQEGEEESNGRADR